MQKIKSFEVNHLVLDKGVYLSRDENNIQTWDVRLRKPYIDKTLTVEEAHSLEHLWATYFRNVYPKETVYVGPMGCQTGFYVITRDLSYKQVLEAIYHATLFVIQEYGRGKSIPGNSPKECGNCHTLSMDCAYRVASQFLPVILNLYNENNNDNMNYQVGKYVEPMKELKEEVIKLSLDDVRVTDDTNEIQWSADTFWRF